MTEVGTHQPGAVAKSPMIFTDAAAEKVAALIAEENNPALKLRVFITGGGCSGFQYGFTFDEEQNSDDRVIRKKVTRLPVPDAPLQEVGEQKDEKKTVSGEESDDGNEGSGGMGSDVLLLIDPMSFQYLIGSEIDYKEDLQGARFVIRNPNAKTTCGCGSSFSL